MANANDTITVRIPNEIGLIDYKKSKFNEHYVPVILPAGVHRVKKIRNPYGYEVPWLVLADNPTVGISEAAWFKLGNAITV